MIRKDDTSVGSVVRTSGSHKVARPAQLFAILVGAVSVAFGEATEYESGGDFYDAMVGDRTAHIAFYTSLIGTEPASVVDLACGTGVITAAMATAVRTKTPLGTQRVCGIDGSPRMLARARMLDPTIEWIHGDIRQVPQMEPFDLATCCFHSLQAFDRESFALVLGSARRLLRTGGRFAFDIYRPNRSAIAVAPRERLVRSYTDSRGQKLVIHERSSFDVCTDIYSLQWTLLAAHDGRQDPQAQFHFRFWQHDPEPVDAALHAAGFAVSERYGDLDRSQYDSDAKRQVLVCKAV
jgi:SAM-dependent methyltransferase